MTGIYDDKAGGKALPADNVSVINNGRECFATIPLKPGYALQWSIQAVQAVDGRSFYSYPMRGETAGCEKQPIVEKSDEAVARPDISVVENEPKSGLSIFPNPVTGELTINWTGEYRGQANLAILDASGKPVTVMNIRKEQSSYVQRMSANAYSSGIYIIYISMYNGRSVSTRFVKN
ncbi:MAG TPA: T9SS type A sorting domain-containing protein [Chitinophagaceae bacterium]|nr:T9SS type A sorting domain-containing protein [Chitinophagaceae bacterium]